MLQTDKRFTGMAKYILQIGFYWTSSIKTAAAGAGFIFFNPDFWDKLNEEKRKTVMAHEIWHLVLRHLERGEGKDPDSYNIAADHVINNQLNQDGFREMHEGADFAGITPCCDPQYKGLSTEQVYAKVHKERKKNPKSQQAPEGTPSAEQIKDLIKEALDGTSKDVQQQIEEDGKKIEATIKESTQAGTMNGNETRILETEGLKIFIKEATYEEIFEPWLTDPLSGGKRTFLRPSRRQVKGGLRMKGKFPKRGRKNRLTHLAYCLDVSGSISHHQGQQFLRSAKTLKERLNPTLMTVILWDTRIVFEKVFREDENLDNIRVSAGGGTNLSPVYKRLSQLQPEAAVIFTDFCVDIPPQPSWETIWFATSKSDRVSHVGYGDIYLIPEK